ncbi:4459_t:CDS:2 [Paraglomus brasilianum]|uniref:3-hydroxy-3-methylglutaryl coenzyme A reductase n=1 Tax=Paraglomus brasilianum TaxID=144538 RepID=A0A9N9F143_9GLOM|nr:4459_t:CDS:2 [Paraglomus brasilianum]
MKPRTLPCSVSYGNHVPITTGSRSWASGFYKRTLRERQNILIEAFPEVFGRNSLETISLDMNSQSVYVTPDTSSCRSPIEVDPTTIGLPVGLALNFVINDKPIVIPMAIEEPSVIAAASGAAKTIKKFTAVAPEKNMITSQIAVTNIPESKMDDAITNIQTHKNSIISLANTFVPNMIKRGGGVRNITTRRIRRKRNPHPRHVELCQENFTEWLIVHVQIDVCDAMGANCANAVAEGIATKIEDITGGKVSLRIVSNFSTERIVKASFRVPVASLGYKTHTGRSVALGIVQAYEMAQIDPYRATTHNKGIMNGIDAVALATGQDWRAIEAGAHAWAACRNDIERYEPLTMYWIEKEDRMEENGQRDDTGLYLCGEINVPICVGTAGGVLATNPVYKYNLGLMGNPSSSELAMAMACVGLAQNFAALRALTTEGIQQGHMKLHAKNIVIAAGCPSSAITTVTDRMVDTGRISFAAAKDLIGTTAKKGMEVIKNGEKNFGEITASLECSPSVLVTLWRTEINNKV